MEDTRYFRKGLGNREDVAESLTNDYHSGIVDYLMAHGHALRHGDTEVRLAREFGFCYGVERAVEYAYETRERFPDRAIWITGEIIHNPGVNRRLQEMGIRFLPPRSAGADRLDVVGPQDVVLIPAFGVEHADFLRLIERGSILVDTTCGSVLTVWKSVEKYARNGVTTVIHGKVDHEETLATCSQVRKYPGAHYVVVRDLEEAGWICEFVEGVLSGTELTRRLAGACSEGFRPERDLRRIGLANQTTMLSAESLQIASLLRAALARRLDESALAEAFHSFDTICSATQDRQDAVAELIRGGCDLMLVLGGFNSSNTTHLVEIAAQSVRTYHIEDADNLISPVWIRHQRLHESSAVLEEGWLPSGPLSLCMTAGASTPNSEIGRSVARLLAFRGVPEEMIRELAAEGTRVAQAGRALRPEPPASRPAE